MPSRESFHFSHQIFDNPPEKNVQNEKTNSRPWYFKSNCQQLRINISCKLYADLGHHNPAIIQFRTNRNIEFEFHRLRTHCKQGNLWLQQSLPRTPGYSLIGTASIWYNQNWLDIMNSHCHLCNSIPLIVFNSWIFINWLLTSARTKIALEIKTSKMQVRMR